METKHLLEVRDLHVHFKLLNGQVRAVNGVNLYIDKGESVGIGGESGCGKSITVSSVMGLLPEEAKIVKGEILYRYSDDKIVDIAKLTNKSPEMLQLRKKEMSMIFQEPSASLSPLHTVYQQMQEALDGREHMSKKEKVEACENLLSMVGIRQSERWVNEYPFRLSGGMAQRVMIAQALAKNSRVLFADEPTTALDVTVQAQVLKLMDDLRRKLDIGMVFITHNMGILAHMTQRIYIMYLGKIVETAPTNTIFEEPAHPYTQGLIACAPTMDLQKTTRLYNIKGMVTPNDAFMEGCSFYKRCEKRMAGLCDKCPPPTVDLGNNHCVSCHLYAKEGTCNGE